MKDIEVSVVEHNVHGESVTVTENGLDPDHVAMGLVRAVTGVCMQMGIDSPAKLFRAADDGVARLHEVRSQEELSGVNAALTAHGFEDYQGAHGVNVVLGHLTTQASLGAALGPGFAWALEQARGAHGLASLAGRDLDAHDSAGIPKTAEPGQVATFVRAVRALGELLHTMRAIEPPPVDNGDGTHTHTLTRAIPIGPPEGDTEITAGRGEPC